MSRNYLIYWQPKNAEYMRSRTPTLDYVSSNQFRHFESGDVLWIITARKGRLLLVGRLTVAERSDWGGAVEFLGRENLRRARFFVLAKRGTEEPMSEISLEDIAPLIRFDSNHSDRFNISDGKINPQQVQAIRQLTNSTSQMFEAKWNDRSINLEGNKSDLKRSIGKR